MRERERENAGTFQFSIEYTVLSNGLESVSCDQHRKIYLYLCEICYKTLQKTKRTQVKAKLCSEDKNRSNHSVIE